MNRALSAALHVSTLCLVALSASPAAAAQAQTSAVPYTAAMAIELGVTPQTLAAADLDNDGDIDLVVPAGVTSFSIAALLNNGYGTFAAPQFFPLDVSPLRVAVGKFNSDAWPDLLIMGASTSSLRVAFGTGGGAFAPVILVNVAGTVCDIAAADVTGDGISDLIASVEPGWIRTLRSNPDGTFTPLASSSLPHTCLNFAVGYINADAASDVVAARRGSGASDALYVRLGNNAGAFAGGVDLPSYFPDDVVLHDFNVDGALDIASFRSLSSQVALQLGDGLGGFGAASLTNALSDIKQFAVTEFDQDGLPDLISAGLNGVELFKGLGTSFTDIGAYACGDAHALALADFDGNGHADIAIPDKSHWGVVGGDDVRILFGDGAARFRAPAVLRFAFTGFVADSANLGIGDVDADGDPDLIGAIVSRLHVRRGDGTGAFTDASPFGQQSQRVTLIRAGDLDGDSRADAVYGRQKYIYATTNEPGALRVQMAPPGSTFAPPVELVAVTGADVTGFSLVDLDGDGDLDIVSQWNAPPNLRAFVNSGTGTFTAVTPADPVPYASLLGIGKVDGDMYADLVLGTEGTGPVHVLRGNGDGSFSAPTAIGISGYMRGIGLGDLDGDGLDELIAATSTALQVFPNLGGGVFGAAATYGHDSNKARCVVADVDGDARNDVLTADKDDDAIAIWLGNGLGELSGPINLVGIPNGRHIDAHDLDLDGRLDLVFGMGPYGEAVIFMHDGRPRAAPYCTAGTSSNGCVAAISGNGTPSASFTSGFSIDIANVEGQRFGIIFYGVNNAGYAPVPWSAGGSSYLCVKSPTQRTITSNSGGTTNACNGALTLDWNAYFATHPTSLGHPYAPGLTCYAQAWFRDPPAAKTTNLSNALQFSVAP